MSYVLYFHVPVSHVSHKMETNDSRLFHTPVTVSHFDGQRLPGDALCLCHSEQNLQIDLKKKINLQIDFFFFLLFNSDMMHNWLTSVTQ